MKEKMKVRELYNEYNNKSTWLYLFSVIAVFILGFYLGGTSALTQTGLSYTEASQWFFIVTMGVTAFFLYIGIYQSWRSRKAFEETLL